MGFVTGQVFDSQASELGETLCASVNGFAKRNKLSQLNRAALYQMSMPLDDLSKEFLMFGLDQWPGSAAEVEAEQEQPKLIDLKRVTRHLPKARTLTLMAASMAVFGIGGAYAHKTLDMDGDGHITVGDLHAALDFALTGQTKHIRRQVVFNGKAREVIISWGSPGGAYEVEAIVDVIDPEKLRTPAEASLIEASTAIDYTGAVQPYL